MSVALDGNTMAGALGELFAVDVSVAVFECAGCGHAGVVAEVVVYADAPGMVGRCPAVPMCYCVSFDQTAERGST